MLKSKLQDSTQGQPANTNPAWRLTEPVPDGGPSRFVWKWLLLAAFLLELAWIIALVSMATR